MVDFLRDKLPAKVPVSERMALGEFFDAKGRPLAIDTPYRHSTMIWFHRPLAPETPIPGSIPIVFENDRIVVVDKPGFLATIPRGAYVRESLVFKVRQWDGYEDAVPAHRLDRLTSGLVLMVKDKRYRSVYAELFAQRTVQKRYEALAQCPEGELLPSEIMGRLEKPSGSLQVMVTQGEPNAHTRVRLVEQRGNVGLYALSPVTGRMHQLRVHMCSIGRPLIGDPLYPTVKDPWEDDLNNPLRLVARSLEFIDPVDRSSVCITSTRRLAWPNESA